MEFPTSLKIANAKGKILSAVNEVSVKYGLPAFILEGIFANIMLEIKSQAGIETLNDVNVILNDKSEKEE